MPVEKPALVHRGQAQWRRRLKGRRHVLDGICGRERLLICEGCERRFGVPSVETFGDAYVGVEGDWFILGRADCDHPEHRANGAELDTSRTCRGAMVSQATDYSAIREDGTVCIGGRYVRPSAQPRRCAIRAVFNEEEPDIRRDNLRRRPELPRRRRARSRWSTYRLVRSGVHRAWCRVTRDLNGW